MFANFSNFLMVLALALVLYYLIPPSQPRARQFVLIAVSVFVILAISPVALVAASAMAVLTFAFVIFSRRKGGSSIGAWITTAALVAVVVFLKNSASGLSNVDTIGLSYVLLKAISVVWLVKWENYDAAALRFADIALLSLFFPIYSAGPIERAKTFFPDAVSAPFQLENALYGIYRILVGVFLIQFLSNDVIVPALGRLGPVDQLSTGATWIYIWGKFLALYLDFSGYTHIAIGSSRLFGISVMENFNFPIISGSIREFWTRWHMSLGKFVSTFLFLPMVRLMKGAVGIPIFISFVLVGLWHELSVPYLIWGVCHGSLLAFYHLYDRQCRRHTGWDNFRQTNILWRLITILGTVSAVSLLSVFANTAQIEDGWSLVARAFAIG